MAKATREEMLKEAIERVKLLKLHPNVARELADGVINYSERTPLGGILYWLKNEPEYVNIVKEIEDKYDMLVYHCTHERTTFGDLLSCLYVTNDKDEWEADKDDLKEDGVLNVYAYVYNMTYPEFSETGSIGVRNVGGGLIREY